MSDSFSSLIVWNGSFKQIEGKQLKLKLTPAGLLLEPVEPRMAPPGDYL
jgi:hypothetical protein